MALLTGKNSVQILDHQMVTEEVQVDQQSGAPCIGYGEMGDGATNEPCRCTLPDLKLLRFDAPLRTSISTKSAHLSTTLNLLRDPAFWFWAVLGHMGNGPTIVALLRLMARCSRGTRCCGQMRTARRRFARRIHSHHAFPVGDRSLALEPEETGYSTALDHSLAIHLVRQTLDTGLVDDPVADVGS